MKDLMREYERARYPEDRRLDLHGEGPRVARERALQWIQSRAHEAPGQELLLILERGARAGRAPTPVTESVQQLLGELEGKLIDWWQPFTPGTIAVRVAHRPNVLPEPADRRPERSAEQPEWSDQAARAAPLLDIPPELQELARRAAELRLAREGFGMGLEAVILREIWIEAQALAMDRRITFEKALRRVHDEELRRQEDLP